MALKPLSPETVKFLVVHCAASQPKADIDVQTIDRWHRKRGFAKVGYHFVIKTDGTIQEGRKLTEMGAHVQGHNHHSLGICLVGGVDAEGKSVDNFTAAQKDALRRLLLKLILTYTKASILGHRDIPGVKKDCPCFSVRDWLKGNATTA
jgi:N-acetyl-anhydromuramyl-L-alanine amidase AmpD